MTNPNNAVGTNAAYNGRTSVNAFNDDLSLLNRGIISGWACAPDSGLSVVLGGSGTTRDVAVAEDNIGNKTSINNISGSPISVIIGPAPAADSRIDLIVAYVDNPPTGTSTVADNYGACGLIVVAGTPASTPTAPDDNDIRTAIVADGASGATAYYVVLAQITIASGTTDIDNTMIQQGAQSGVGTNNINDSAVTADKIDFTTLLPRLIQSNEKAFATAASDTAIYGDEITISETGTYFVYVTARTYATGSTGVLFTYINRNGTNLIFTNSITANNGRVYGDIATTWTFNAGDKIKGGFYGTAALGSLNGTTVTLLVLRVS